MCLGVASPVDTDGRPPFPYGLVREHTGGREGGKFLTVFAIIMGFQHVYYSDRHNTLILCFSLDPEHKVEKHLYPFWAGCVAGPVVYILALIHALLWGFPSAIVGSVVSLSL